MDHATGRRTVRDRAQRGFARWQYSRPATQILLVVLAALAVAESAYELVAARDSNTGLPLAQVTARAGDGTVIGSRLAVIVALICLLIALPLVLPRPLPAAAAAVTLANIGSLTMFHTATVAGIAIQLLVHYRLGRAGSAIPALYLAAPFLLLSLLNRTDPGYLVRAVLLTGLAPGAALAGHARWSTGLDRERRDTQEAIAGTLLENTARGERARIARELHDVVAHHISMISIQAETARLTTPGMPEEGAKRLLVLGNTARAALTEMRRLLGVLREDTEPDREDLRAVRRPQPDLSHLNELLDEARTVSGTLVRLIVRGRPVELDPSRELAVYRIIQESLSNARRHAPGAAVDVELVSTDAELLVRVRDNGPGPAAEIPAGGHGLLGMRERAAAAGGRLRVGSAAGGGFAIEATFPVSEEEPS